MSITTTFLDAQNISGVHPEQPVIVMVGRFAGMQGEIQKGLEAAYQKKNVKNDLCIQVILTNLFDNRSALATIKEDQLKGILALWIDFDPDKQAEDQIKNLVMNYQQQCVMGMVKSTLNDITYEFVNEHCIKLGVGVYTEHTEWFGGIIEKSML